MNTENTFANRLKELRNIRNYTQEVLGKITNISVQSIRRYEQGKLNEEPSAYNLLQLAKALDVTPEYLLIGDNNMSSYTDSEIGRIGMCTFLSGFFLSVTNQ